MPNLYPEQKRRLFNFLILVIAFTAFATGLNFAAGKNAFADKKAGTLGVSDHRDEIATAKDTVTLKQLRGLSPYQYELILPDDKLKGIEADEIVRLNLTDCENLDNSIDLGIVNNISSNESRTIEFRTTEELKVQQQITLTTNSNQLLIGCINITY